MAALFPRKKGGQLTSNDRISRGASKTPSMVVAEDLLAVPAAPVPLVVALPQLVVWEPPAAPVPLVVAERAAAGLALVAGSNSSRAARWTDLPQQAVPLAAF